MKTKITDLPQGNVSVVKTGGWDYVTMYNNVKETKDESGQTILNYQVYN